MKITYPCIVVAISLFSVVAIYAQNGSGCLISGNIQGVSDGKEVVLRSLTGRKLTTKVQSGKFSFNPTIEISGEPYIISIESLTKELQLFPDNNSTIYLTGDTANWPICDYEGSKNLDRYHVFIKEVDSPFKTAYANYLESKKTLNGSGGESSEGRPTLQQLLQEQIYKTATQAYIKGVFLWIGMNPDSYSSPHLIMMWWPHEDRRAAYNRLTKKVRESFYGKALLDQIKER